MEYVEKKRAFNGREKEINKKGSKKKVHNILVVALRFGIVLSLIGSHHVTLSEA